MSLFKSSGRTSTPPPPPPSERKPFMIMHTPGLSEEGGRTLDSMATSLPGMGSFAKHMKESGQVLDEATANLLWITDAPDGKGKLLVLRLGAICTTCAPGGKGLSLMAMNAFLKGMLKRNGLQNIYSQFLIGEANGNILSFNGEVPASAQAAALRPLLAPPPGSTLRLAS